MEQLHIGVLPRLDAFHRRRDTVDAHELQPPALGDDLGQARADQRAFDIGGHVQIVLIGGGDGDVGARPHIVDRLGHAWKGLAQERRVAFAERPQDHPHRGAIGPGRRYRGEESGEIGGGDVAGARMRADHAVGGAREGRSGEARLGFRLLERPGGDGDVERAVHRRRDRPGTAETGDDLDLDARLVSLESRAQALHKFGGGAGAADAQDRALRRRRTAGGEQRETEKQAQRPFRASWIHADPHQTQGGHFRINAINRI
ncbi:hypothetical protein LL06_21315 [Hoeflea sp. BAL378]|nr:hypothetical protein LL06_21315 [Hoeflea sp. BAL378]